MRTMPRVLIVEDEAPIAELIAVNLRHNGFQPTWAMDSETAQRELDAVLPDVILLDWMLPGESGLSLAKKWRKDARTKGVPILMLTANTSPQLAVGAMRAGATDYLVKPVRRERLAAALDATEVSCVRLALATKDEDVIGRAADACTNVTMERDVALGMGNHLLLVDRHGLGRGPWNMRDNCPKPIR